MSDSKKQNQIGPTPRKRRDKLYLRPGCIETVSATQEESQEALYSISYFNLDSWQWHASTSTVNMMLVDETTFLFEVSLVLTRLRLRVGLSLSFDLALA